MVSASDVFLSVVGVTRVSDRNAKKVFFSDRLKRPGPALKDREFAVFDPLVETLKWPFPIVRIDRPQPLGVVGRHQINRRLSEADPWIFLLIEPIATDVVEHCVTATPHLERARSKAERR